MKNEKRLIDADALLQFALNRYGNTLIPNDIKSFPTVDAVEVVRCKDCKHCQHDAYGLWCFNDYERSLQPDDFCSYGERRKQ